jgi:hypothetical protein
VHLGQGQQWGGRTKGNNQQLQQQQQQQQQASDAGVQLGFCAVTGDAAGDAAGAAAGARYIVRFNAYSAADDLRRQLQQVGARACWWRNRSSDDRAVCGRVRG